jgi:hypothetical protein
MTSSRRGPGGPAGPENQPVFQAEVETIDGIGEVQVPPRM